MAADAPAKRGLTGKAVETQVKRPRGRPYKFLGQRLPIHFVKTNLKMQKKILSFPNYFAEDEAKGDITRGCQLQTKF